MALTEELLIYRATYRLLNMLIRATQDFPRFYKYSLGTRMVDVCLDMSMLLYKANSSYEKVELIKEFLSKFSILQMLLRVCAEQKVIDTKKVAVFALEMEKIGKQATGWKQYNEKGLSTGRLVLLVKTKQITIIGRVRRTTTIRRTILDLPENMPDTEME
ncbi:four helix bundle protein [Phocaeicola sartorii]|uniref:four helix bundle protein n=1 Tax=Phocaeicola sartorii TaxID=671267 RepID=UPI00258A237E|nr:four helix bundle protein [Phocaeicola sartorii]